MRSTLVAIQFFLTILVWTAGPAVQAEHFRLAMPSEDDDYIIQLFALALEAEGGEHTFEVIHRVMLMQDRALRELADNRARYDVHYSGYDPKREQEFAMVHFPLTRGMLGHRLLAIRAEDQNKLQNVKTLEDLKQFYIGSGNDWPDTKIMKAAGLNVVAGSDATLWPMLARGRFDAFPRGMNEIMAEIEVEGRGKYGVDLTIDRHVMLVYRYDHFFYLAKENQAKADIIERGLVNAYKSGALDRFLDSVPHFVAVRQEMNENPRQVIRLDNPLLGDCVWRIPADYWRDY